MKIILKSGQIIWATRIWFSHHLVRYESAEEQGELMMSVIEDIWDAQTYDNMLSGH